MKALVCTGVVCRLLILSWSAWMLMIWAPTVGAQGISAQVDVPLDQRVQTPLSNMNSSVLLGPSRVDDIEPFGASLFKGGFRSKLTSDLNPGYIIMPGDQVTVRAWGALEVDLVLTVDTQGNIFIPDVGPVQVKDVSAADLNARVTKAIKAIYTDNVSVYTNLQGVQPVAVFVTGFVKKPGRYSGTPSDSVLNFLDQAGGIDVASGSFRDVRVLRDHRLIAQVDLYPFLLDGSLPRPQFADGDTIVVGRQGSMVTVSGDVAQPHRYELTETTQSVADLMHWIQLRPGVSRVLVTGVRDVGPFSSYVSLDDLTSHWLQSGDELLFSVDQRQETIVVQLEGSFKGPSRFTVPRNAQLMELLDSIPVDPELSDVSSVSIRRKSVAQRQRESLDESLKRLETAYLGASSSTVDESKIRVEEAKLIQDFVKRARQLEPTGRLVVAEGGKVRNTSLQDGDVITIPNRSDSIFVSGEVLVPQAMIYKRRQRVDDYIQRAGGFTDRANTFNVLLSRQSGEVVSAASTKLRPGDEILVLPKVSTKNLEVAKVLTDILYKLAYTTKIAYDFSTVLQ